MGVIPAAGRSARLGKPKALLDAGGRTFLDRVVTALSQGGCDRVIVVVEEAGGVLGATAQRAGALVLENPSPEDGPISSVRVAVGGLEEGVSAIALCPVDHPLVLPETVACLLAAFRAGDKRIVVPTHGGRRGHPLILDASLLPELLSDELPEGVRTLVRRHSSERMEIPVEDEGVLVDIDTLPDYRRHFPAEYRRRFQSR